MTQTIETTFLQKFRPHTQPAGHHRPPPSRSCHDTFVPTRTERQHTGAARGRASEKPTLTLAAALSAINLAAQSDDTVGKLMRYSVTIQNLLRRHQNGTFEQGPMPHEYTCVLSHHVFVVPVLAPDGQVYEKDEICRWLAYKQTSPVTRQGMHRQDLVLFTQMRHLIERDPRAATAIKQARLRKFEADAEYCQTAIVPARVPMLLEEERLAQYPRMLEQRRHYGWGWIVAFADHVLLNVQRAPRASGRTAPDCVGWHLFSKVFKGGTVEMSRRDSHSFILMLLRDKVLGQGRRINERAWDHYKRQYACYSSDHIFTLISLTLDILADETVRRERLLRTYRGFPLLHALAQLPSGHISQRTIRLQNF